MVHISQSKKNGQFYVTVKSSKNGSKLSVSETLKTKRSAWTNVLAQMKVFQTSPVLVQDNTGKKPVVYRLYENGRKDCTAYRREKPPTVK